MTEKKALHFIKGETSYTFIKPDCEEFHHKVIMILQDAFGQLDIHAVDPSYLWHKAIINSGQQKELEEFIK